MKNRFALFAAIVVSISLIAFSAYSPPEPPEPPPVQNWRNVYAYLTSQCTVTQTGAITTHVTCNAYNGVVTTVASTLGKGAKTSFWVRNNVCDTLSQVKPAIEYAGSNGRPIVWLGDVKKDSFQVVIANADTADALNALLKVHYNLSN